MATVQVLSEQIAANCGSALVSNVIRFGELTIEVMPAQLLRVCEMLKEYSEFDFNMLVDVCGVDYLHYGLDDWQTETTTRTGFGRGVTAELKAESYPHFSEQQIWLEEMQLPEISHPPESESLAKLPAETADKMRLYETAPKGHRFSVVYHLLSLSHNHRIRVRVNILEDQPLIIDSVIAIWPSADWFEREVFDLFGIIFKDHPDLRRILTDYGFIGHPFRKDFPLIGTVEARYDAKLKRVIYEPVSIPPRVLEPKVIRHDNRYTIPKSDQSV